eukprot:5993826-Pyramimonas_sp.AAC.1
MTEDDGSEFPHEQTLPLLPSVSAPSAVYGGDNSVQFPSRSPIVPQDTFITLSTEGNGRVEKVERFESRNSKYKKGNKQNRPSRIDRDNGKNPEKS